jgi:hypothetical protein
MVNLSNLPQAVYRRHEIPNADYLMSFQQALRDEFVNGYKSLEHISRFIGRPSLNRKDYPGAPAGYSASSELIQTKDPKTKQYRPDLKGWLSVLFKYNIGDPNSPANYEMNSLDGRAIKFKTAYSLVKEFGDKCPIAQYSIMAPSAILNRHTGIENRDGKYIRIHIPLVIPEGDVFLEVNGEECRWDDIFGFNNQFAHSAYNYTDEYRLVFIIDLDREYIGMEPGASYDERFDELAKKPFIRKLQGQTHE